MDAPTIIEETVLEKIVNAHTAALTLYARQFFDNGNFHAAEEVVQEVFHRLSGQPTLPENLVGWLYTAVRNGAISAARSDKRRQRRETNWHGTNWHGATRQPPLFQPQCQFDDESPLDTEKIALCLAKLDGECREIVTLHIWSDLPFSEIASLLGKPKTTVWRQYKEALEMLRGMLQESF